MDLLDVYHRARRAAFTGAEAQSQLAETPYALRHAAVSTYEQVGEPLSPLIAEGVGFEPTRTRQRPSGFQDR